VQLIEISDQFEAMGLNVAAMTYDSVEMLKTVEEVVKRRAGNEMFALSKSGQYKARRIFNPGISRSKADPAVRYWLELVDLSNQKEFVIVGTLESRLQRMGVVEKVSTPKRLATGTSGS